MRKLNTTEHDIENIYRVKNKTIHAVYALSYIHCGEVYGNGAEKFFLKLKNEDIPLLFFRKSYGDALKISYEYPEPMIITNESEYIIKETSESFRTARNNTIRDITFHVFGSEVFGVSLLLDPGIISFFCFGDEIYSFDERRNIEMDAELTYEEVIKHVSRS